MKTFFNPDNWLWKGFGRLADYFLLSACWLLCSIPLVTTGAASIALYDTVAHCVKGGEGEMLARFFRTLKNELLRGILLTVFWGVIALGLNFGYQVLSQMEGSTMGLISTVYFFALLLPLGCVCWCVALESRFTNSFGQLLKNSLTFTFGHLPQTLIISVILVLTINLCANMPFFLMIVPGLAAHLQSHAIEKVFKKYMPEDEEESIEEAQETA